MPNLNHSWTCRVCGVSFDEEGFAKTCEKSHMHPNNLIIKDIDGLPGAKYAYSPQAVFPDMLLISNGDGKQAIYTLAENPRKAARSLGAIRLRPPGG